MPPALPLLLSFTLTAAAAARAPAPERGLWFGPIPICRDSAASAVLAEDLDGRPALTVTLVPEWRERLEQATAQLVGKAMPVRLDGRTVSEPIVHDPITGGALHLSGLSAAEAEAIGAAALRACGG